MKKKTKRYQDGGIVINQQPAQQANPQSVSATSGYFGNTTSTYPFQSSSTAPAATDPNSGLSQTFNIQPSAQAGQPTTMKRGGRVTSASKRADGCAIRGKTRA